jgi:6-methylsalicylate decarboxylase
VDLAEHDPARRQDLADADGLDRVVVAPSTPLGVEALPAAEAEPLLAAYHAGAAALPARFRAWAAVGLEKPDPAAVAWYAFAVWDAPRTRACVCASRCSPGWRPCTASG